MDVRVGLWRKLSTEELMFLNCGVGVDSWVPWNARRSNQFILKEISPEYSLERWILKLKLQYFGYLMPKADSSGKTLMLGKIEGRRRRGQQRMRWLDGIIDSMDMSFSKIRELVMDMEDRHAAAHEVTKSRIQLSDWTELNWHRLLYILPMKWGDTWATHTHTYPCICTLNFYNFWHGLLQTTFGNHFL